MPVAAARREGGVGFTQADPRAGLTIRVSSGVGSGSTRLAAFDAALRSAGVGDFNLIRLSSVIPPSSVVRIVEGSQQLIGGHGDLLYCVYAVAYADPVQDRAWAGVAWSRRADSGHGLFVEHSGASHDAVNHDLGLSLRDLSSGRGGDFVEVGRRLVSVSYVDRPACAVVVATYHHTGWTDDDR